MVAPALRLSRVARSITRPTVLPLSARGPPPFLRLLRLVDGLRLLARSNESTPPPSYLTLVFLQQLVQTDVRMARTAPPNRSSPAVAVILLGALVPQFNPLEL